MGTPAVTTQPGRASPAGRLLAVNFAPCLLLLVQYLLGMAVNLYVVLPGVSFLNYGHAFSSMIMAGLWALALACYITSLFLAARRLVLGSA